MLFTRARPLKPGRFIANVLVLVATAVAAGCGSDMPSPQEAASALHKIDSAVVRAHNSVAVELRTSTSCIEGAGIAITRCEKIAKRSIKSLSKIKRRLRGAYAKTPAYARKIYSAAYRSELRFQDATRAFQYEFLRFTRLNYSKSGTKRDLKRLDDAETRTKKYLKKARSAVKTYIAEL